ncbi:MAG: M24 family metallopeptidase [Verrucomicrobiales bacterium]
MSGIENIHWLEDFERIFKEVMFQAENVYLHTNEHNRAETTVVTRNDRFVRRCKEQYPLHRFEAPRGDHRLPALGQTARGNRAPARSLRHHRKGFRRVCEFTKPGVWEFEVEAEFAHEFLRNRSKGFAYLPIIASGAMPASCIISTTTRRAKTAISCFSTSLPNTLTTTPT